MGLAGSFGLSFAAIVGSFIGVFAVYWAVTTYIQYRKLQHIKGPWLAAISPLWMFYYTCRGTLYLAVEDALKKYGERPEFPQAHVDQPGDNRLARAHCAGLHCDR